MQCLSADGNCDTYKHTGLVCEICRKAHEQYVELERAKTTREALAWLRHLGYKIEEPSK